MTSPPPTLHGRTLREALGVETDSAARRIVHRLGVPFVRVGRRVVVRREAFDEWLREREERTEVAQGPAPVPTPPAWAKDLLKRGRRSGLTAAQARKGAGGAS